MNHIYRVIWNVSLGLWQVTTEVARGRSKSSSNRAARTWMALTTLGLAGNAAYAELPTGGAIVAGNGQISQTGSVMTITQTSQRMAADWQNFNVGVGNTVQFIQPSSTAVALNRVLGTDVSVIQGSIRANGQIFLVNPNGVLFSPTAQVNVGSMVASTLQISTADFMAGNYRFENAGGGNVRGSSIVNQGHIQASTGGSVALIAGRISNAGTISTPQGNTLLGAGSKVTLDLGGPVKLQVETGALDALIEQGGVIRADGGTVYLTAKALGDLTSSVINQTGIIEARTLSSGERGQITLLGDGEFIQVGGTLDASAPDGGVGGRIVASGTHVLIDDHAHLNASGRHGGGEVLVGGSWQNSDPSVYQATGTLVKASAVLEANAIETGDGGTVVAWSDIHQVDSATRVYGSLQARGGAQSGNGGRIETSGHWLDVAGIRADSSARHGDAGQWLLDPYNVTIGSSASGTAYATPFTPGADSSILASDIAASLEGGTNVTITTGTTGSTSIGDITVSSTISKTSGDTDVTLTLRAANSIAIDQAITNSGGAGKLNIVLDADNNNGVRDGGGIIILNNDISTGGGNLAFGTGATMTLNSITTLVGGDVYVAGSGARTLSTGGGTVTVNGEMMIANPAGLSINTQGGNVSFLGVLNSANQYDFINKTGVAGTGSWSQARAEAIGATGGGSAIGDTYLVTIGSRLENAVAARSTGYVGAWIGAWRPSTSALNWTWANGPEGGTNFFNQAAFVGGASGPGGANGTPVNGSYQNFGSGEPNGGNLANSEHVGQFFGTLAKWNDLIDGTTYATSGNTNQYAVKGFVRETNLAASPLTINAGTGSVTFNRQVGGVKALASLSVTASDIAINGGATTEGVQTYAATGTVTQGGALSANGLALLGTGGNYTLNNTANDVVTLVANTGTVRFTNSTALNVGTIGSTNGISATGIVSVATQSGDLTVSQNIATTDSSDAAIVLNAGKTTAAGTSTGGDIVLTGSPLISIGAGGRATLMSGSISGSTGLTNLIGSGSGRFRYNSDETDTNYSTALGTGLYAVYREQPIAVIATDNQSMVYGNALPTLTGTVSAMVNGDVAGALSPTSPTYSGSGALNAGSYAITPTSLTALGYGLSGTTGTLTVGQRTLTVNYTGVNKTYDRNTSSSVTTSDNRLMGDTLTILRTAAFVDRNAGSGKTVNITGVSLTGTDAGNYTVATTGSTTADITPRTLNVTYAGVNKVYDGALTATVTTNDDRLGSDALTIVRSAAFGDKNAATGKTVSISGVSLTGTDAGNYTVATTGSTTADITPRTLNVTYAGVSKVYDGLVTASVSTRDDRVSGDNLVIQKSANFLDPNVGTNKPIVINGLLLSGEDAGNYILASTTGSASADIKQDTSLDAALRAPQQLPLPEPVASQGMTTQLAAPADRLTADGIGGLKMVHMSSDPAQAVPGGAEGRRNEGSATSTGLPGAGLDPFGYVRVFVVRGGVNLPTEALSPTEKPAPNGSPR